MQNQEISQIIHNGIKAVWAWQPFKININFI